MRDEEEDFENEVRRVARALWPEARYSGAIKVDGRERDGVFETEECVHLLEATTSRKLEKAKQDIGKLVALTSKFQPRTPHKAVRCWFVTRDEPTADQRHAAERHKAFLIVLAFSQFQARLIDVRAYLAARDNYPFGSVRDPVTGSLRPAVAYVPLALAAPGKSATSAPDVNRRRAARSRTSASGTIGGGTTRSGVGAPLTTAGLGASGLSLAPAAARLSTSWWSP